MLSTPEFYIEPQFQYGRQGPFDFPFVEHSRATETLRQPQTKATKSRQHCNPSRTNAQPSIRAKFGLPARSIAPASARENKFGKSGRRSCGPWWRKLK